MDGGRILVPMTDSHSVGNDEVEYFWKANSLEVRICRVIGKYYIYEDLEGVARRSRVKVVA